MATKESISIDKFGRPFSDLTEEEKKEVQTLYEELQEKSIQKLKGVA